MDDTLYLHCLNLFPKFGPKRLAIMANYFESFQQAFSASVSELVQAGIASEVATEFKVFTHNVVPEAEAEKLLKLNISLLGAQDKLYPTLLKEVELPPQLLYLRGNLPPADSIFLAIVGTRKITTYGRSVIPRLAGPLMDAGLVPVSGLAYGVDAEVARFAVSKHSPTIAVLGSGLDDKAFYPREHVLLAEEIVNCGGAILSEFAPGTPGFKQNFISRNRIIAGLSIGTLIVECDLKSGSLITAQYTLDMNRRLYAVPGPIYTTESRGPNNLIKMGATLVTDSSDILQDLNIDPTLESLVLPDSPQESIILDILGKDTTSADELIVQSGLEPSLVTTTLTFLEIKGVIKNVGAQQYIRVR